MEYVFLAFFPLLIASVIYLSYRLTKSRQSDYEAIDAMLTMRSLRLIAVTKDHNHFRYWIRGYLGLSNVSRLYIITADEQNGSRREIHVAFDDWSSNGDLQVLMDRVTMQRAPTNSPPSEEGAMKAVAAFLEQRDEMAKAKAKQDAAQPSAAPDLPR